MYDFCSRIWAFCHPAEQLADSLFEVLVYGTQLKTLLAKVRTEHLHVARSPSHAVMGPGVSGPETDPVALPPMFAAAVVRPQRQPPLADRPHP